MKSFQIWIGGYRATGEDVKASYLATIEAETFDEAVQKYVKQRSESDWPEIYQYYYREERYVSCEVSNEHPLGRKLDWVHQIWACGLYDNEADARAING